jgi:hypothetical protein
MLWHIYQQDEDIHLDKLEAFLALYVKGFPGRWRGDQRSLAGLECREIMADHWQSPANTGQSWKNAEAWCLEQGLQADLATALVQFYVNWI